MRSEIQRFQSLDELSVTSAEYICQIAQQAVAEHGHFTMALSGGNTPRTLYELLAQEPYIHTIPWSETHLFWGDERAVPVEHPDSNAAMVSQALIKHIPIPLHNVYRIPTEGNTPEEAAAHYESLLHEMLPVFASSPHIPGIPVFDLILLGLGKDGHTASLFPDSPVLNESSRWVSATPVPSMQPPVRRITLTFPVLNAAKVVLFLVSGQEKHEIVNTIIEHPDQARSLYPAAHVRPEGILRWFIV
ncbi:6-phosphogluconolactonase [candidate division KSB3 bacterium]|uniref:6-phosphogluconolactonase n=1 Tax=candidate division KSB3 bacterium TaxID=2044937 RepID=A0A2G6KD51_9BACT|nr:MAG: 6-phosphogluconolactonase [candidate division KSB3 bacterium]